MVLGVGIHRVSYFRSYILLILKYPQLYSEQKYEEYCRFHLKIDILEHCSILHMRANVNIRESSKQHWSEVDAYRTKTGTFKQTGPPIFLVHCSTLM